MADNGFIRYFCTAGNGMERFLTDEVKQKLAAEDVFQMPGKVVFSSSARISRVRELKGAERLFLLLKHDPPVALPAHARPGKAASVLQSKLLADRNQWTCALMTWRRLQGELSARTILTVNTPSSAGGGTVERERGKSEEEEAAVEGDGEFGKRKDDRREVEEKDESGSCKQSEAHRLEKETPHGGGNPSRGDKKRKREEEQSNERGDEGKQGATGRDGRGEEPRGEMERGDGGQDGKNGMILEADLCGRGWVCGREGAVERSGTKTDERAEERAVATVEPVKATGGIDEPSRLEPEPVSFRVSCKCTGSLSRCLSIQEISRVMGAGLSRLLGWKVDLRNPQLEVSVYLSDDHCILGIPLTRLPLANRSYIKTTGLRSTVAWAMASLAQIQPGSRVVDPMCGVGTILIEAAQELKDACLLGADIDDGQLQRANENVEFAELGNRMHLLKASSMALPLPGASVDAVLCDLPFGRKFGTKTDMAANLPLILTEMERVLCVGGTLVLLLSPQLSFLLKKILAPTGTGPTSEQEAETRAAQTLHSPQGVGSPHTQDRHPQAGLRSSLPRPLSSLEHQATLRVSLGAIDGLIHKYVKTNS